MDRKLGIAILGTGDVSNGHIGAYRRNPHVEIRAILSRDAAKAAAKASQFGLENCRAFTNLDALLHADGIDAVSICTPHHLHVEQGIACARAGKHMIVEKPVALDFPGLKKLDAAVREHGVHSGSFVTSSLVAPSESNQRRCDQSRENVDVEDPMP